MLLDTERIALGFSTLFFEVIKEILGPVWNVKIKNMVKNEL